MQITKTVFSELISLQTKVYENNRHSTQYIFDYGLNLCNKEDKFISVKTDEDLDRILRKKAKKWLFRGGFLIGLTAYKQIFWNGYYRTLIPYLLIEYINKRFTSRDLKYLISAEDKGKGINAYLFHKYPLIRQVLGFHAYSYRELLLELEKKGIKDRLGYQKNPDDVIPLQLIPKSVFVDLTKQIEKTRDFIKSNWIKKQIDKYKDVLTQQEIAKKVGKSQQTVSRLLKEV